MSEQITQSRRLHPWHVAPLLLGSGMCAIIYQTAWQREFRLIFGASTAGTAAVLAIFIAGLGLGSWLLGKRADRQTSPLQFYGKLELLIAATAALSPFLLILVRQAYLLTGGSVVLGTAGATVVRLVLASLVLAAPTILMGGTLPAAARAVETSGDRGRRTVGLLYGINTIGAVIGCLVATFMMLEVYGTRRTLLMAALINALVALIALHLARWAGPQPVTESNVEEEELSPTSRPVAPALALTAAMIVGFAFFLMEMVWYRLLTPLLGGTIFTFGLILAAALAGIGIGGALYSFAGQDRPATLRAFAATCLLEALFMALPFAVGDRIPVATMLAADLQVMGFGGMVLVWSIVCGVVVLPAAIFAGYQFPLLIALLGQGRRDVGKQVGLTYAWNTVGAILGALAGGFGIFPLLGLLGSWMLACALLVIIGIVAVVKGTEGNRRSMIPQIVTALLVVVCFLATGPTSAWRHSAIGAQVDKLDENSRNELHKFLNLKRRGISWEKDGVESTVGIDERAAYSFVVNGKNDSNARGDAATTVMAGLIGALVHPAPNECMVIGLGTGMSAGWLAAAPEVKRLQVVELEPAVIEVAQRCALVNHDVLNNPKVKIRIGDAREVLQTSPHKYDVVVSEPSNPYRAGIASLFTTEFYRAVAAKMPRNGLFLQWVQAYDIDPQTMRTIYGTMASVFPEVHTWQLHPYDLLLVASRQGIHYDVAELGRKLQQEPYRSALLHAWHTNTVEGFLSHFVGGPQLPRALYRTERGLLNTDDKTIIEFGFARAVGSRESVDVMQLRDFLSGMGESYPPLSSGRVDPDRLMDEQFLLYTAHGLIPPIVKMKPDQAKRRDAQAHYVNGDLQEAVELWQQQKQPPTNPTELILTATGTADAGDAACEDYLKLLEPTQPVEAAAIRARLFFRQKKYIEAAQEMQKALVQLRTNPWPNDYCLTFAIDFCDNIAGMDGGAARILFDALREPLAIKYLNEVRMNALVRVSAFVDPNLAAKEFEKMEPYFRWERDLLEVRLKVYREVRHPLAGRAAVELDEYLANEPSPLIESLEDAKRIMEQKKAVLGF